MNPDPAIQEILDRTRRTETKLTQFMARTGVDVYVQKPEFSLPMEFDGRDGAAVYVASLHCSIKEILDSIPSTWNGPVGVFVGDEMVATIDNRRNG